MLLAVCGAVAGVGWARRPSVDQRSAIPSFVPLSLEFGLDWRVLAYTLGAALCTGMPRGLWACAAGRTREYNQVLTRRRTKRFGNAARNRVRSILVGRKWRDRWRYSSLPDCLPAACIAVEHMYLGFRTGPLAQRPFSIRMKSDTTRRHTTYLLQGARGPVRALPGVRSVSLAYSVH